MTPYVQDEIDLPILFNKEKIKGCLSEYLSKQNLSQLKIAETEKYAHVTFFFNGGNKQPHKNEDFILIPSPKDVSSYDEKPEMSAHTVTDKLIKAIQEPKYQFLLVNYANGDMVGHTGNFDAAVKAVEILDNCLENLYEACSKNDVTLVITSDHGNCDQMTYEDSSPHTSHTHSPVPFCVVNDKLKGKIISSNNREPALKDIAPTLLEIIGVKKPKEFTGISIFK